MNRVRTFAIGLILLGCVTSSASAAGMRRAIWWRSFWRPPAEAELEMVPERPEFDTGALQAEAQQWSASPWALPVGAVAVTPTVPPVSVEPVSVAVILPAAEPTPLPVYVVPEAISIAAPLVGSQTVYDYDAFVNLGEGPYPQESLLTMGAARPWYDSPVVAGLMGGVPGEAARANFTQNVLDRVEQTFAQSGVSVALTADPTASAAHTLSVVSGTYNSASPDAIGIATMGGDGFSFIDRFEHAQSVDDLEWAVARNIAHELIHAFDVPHLDGTGDYLDAATGSWENLIDPATVFSPEAVSALLAQDFRDRYDGIYGGYLNGQSLDGQVSPVPEPATLAGWTLGTILALASYRRSRHRKAA